MSDGGNFFDDRKAHALRAAFIEKLVDWSLWLEKETSNIETSSDNSDAVTQHLQAISELTHKIAGTAASFGFPITSQNAAKLEEMSERLINTARAPNSSEITALIENVAFLSQTIAREISPATA